MAQPFASDGKRRFSAHFGHKAAPPRPLMKPIAKSRDPVVKKVSFDYTGAMEKSRRELNKINCRKRILKASRKLFSTKGYEDTMIEDIAKKAEISKATVYNYFPNKESLLVGTADEVLDRVRQIEREELTDCASSEQKLRRILEEFVSASVEYIVLSRRITFLNSCEDSALFATRREMTALLRGLIVKAQQEGTFRADADPDEMVDVVMGIYLIAEFQWARVNHYSQEFLHEKLNRFFTVTLSAYYAGTV